jgi:recombination protein RecA
MKILEKRGSWFAFGSEQLAQGREQTKALLQQDKELEKRLLEKIRETLAAGAAPAAIGKGAAADDEAAPAEE